MYIVNMSNITSENTINCSCASIKHTYSLKKANAEDLKGNVYAN